MATGHRARGIELAVVAWGPALAALLGRVHRGDHRGRIGVAGDQIAVGSESELAKLVVRGRALLGANTPGAPDTRMLRSEVS